jgi:hypothetical protein
MDAVKTTRETHIDIAAVNLGDHTGLSETTVR